MKGNQMNNKLNNLYKEKTKSELLRQTNIQYLKKKINEASENDYNYQWFLDDLMNTINDIQTSNEVLEDTITKIDKELANKEF